MQRIIFFDGICPLCNRFINLVFKFDKNRVFKYSSLQSAAAARLLSEPDRKDDTVIYIENDRTYKKSAAVLRILFQLGGAWTLLALVVSALPAGLRDRLYDLVARNRYRLFGQLDTCRLPTAEERAHFLE